jgi:hypothetical protein
MTLTFGKQIRIYLADGTASGVRHAEITNWTGQALACPRSRFSELREWQEIKRPGVYFLFGSSEDTGEEAVYIGESEIVLDRLTSHIAGKEFWAELIAFTSKDDNLTKGHAKYLEARLVQIANDANRYRVTNSAIPALPALPRPDRDAMEEYLVSTRILLGVLGHKVLDPYVSTTKHLPITIDTPSSAAPPTAQPSDSRVLVTSPPQGIFWLHASGINAKAAQTDEGLVVLVGSEASVTAQPSLSGGYRALREKLISQGILVSTAGNSLQLTKDQLFNSPSQAAAVLVGYSINGRDAWRKEDGTTFGQFEEQSSQTLARQLLPIKQ